MQRMPAFRHARSTLWILVVATSLGVATRIVAAGDAVFARICAEREVQVITLIEDHGAAMLSGPIGGNETLGRAGLMLFEARGACYRGRVDEAIALYDTIVTMLGPVPSPRTR
jgi:hypothetical protein